MTLTRLVREATGPVLSENLSLLVVNGARCCSSRSASCSSPGRGSSDIDRLVADCEAGRFPLVVTEHRMWEIPGFGECLERRYEPVADLGPYQALAPRR